MAQLTALLHLASPALPMGALSYLQGLGATVDARHVADKASAAAWTAEDPDVLAAYEAPLWLLQLADWQAGRFDVMVKCDAWFLATRETCELRLETLQMSWSLNRFIRQLEWGNVILRSALAVRAFVTFPTAFAAVAAVLNVDPRNDVTAYCFAWVENQMAVTVKAVPLEQAVGQRILFGLHAAVVRVMEEVTCRVASHPPELSTFSSGLGVLSTWHET